MAKEKRRPGRSAPRPMEQNDSANNASDRSRRAPGNAGRSNGSLPVLRMLLPVASVVLAFVSIVLVYRWVFPPPEPEPMPEDAAPAQGEEATADDGAPVGVEDPWTASGTFTMGDSELDEQIKAFCDALSLDGYSAEQNAEVVYDAIVWSNYEERTQDQKPAGNSWDTALMRNFFSTGNPSVGEGGSGDAYEFAATTSYCLRYFGFDDAMAVPVLKTDDYGNSVSSALVLVTDADGNERVCDPDLSGEGWMLDRDSYDVTVENLGQDLTAVEELGLTVKESPKPTTVPDSEEQGETPSPYTLDELMSMYEQNHSNASDGQEAGDSQEAEGDQSEDAYSDSYGEDEYGDSTGYDEGSGENYY